MANPEHLQILQQGVEAWNAWRDSQRDITPDLRWAELREADLGEADLGEADLRWAELRRATLRGATLRRADLSEANLSEATLRRADLSEANLGGANLSGALLFRAFLGGAILSGAILSEAFLSEAFLSEADLRRAFLGGATLSEVDLSGAFLSEANLRSADLSRANLSQALLYETIFSNTNLTAVRGLETCRHHGPSTLDHRTLAKSGLLPLAFLRGCGLPEALIEYLLSLINQPFQFYSCFISYASKDHAFAERLYADLQNKGVRCWFAPQDLPIGAPIRVSIDETIRVYEKLLLVLSKASVTSQWVEQEVETALAREREQKTTILFPVRIDNTVMTIKAGWPALVRNARNIGDFRRWKTHNVYQQALDRLLRDLTAPAAPRLD